jgi:ABC-type multidrug transport system fused ATPase/permease subunit
MKYQEEESFIDNILFLWSYVSRGRVGLLLFLLLLMLISVFMEVFTIGLVIPFLSALMSPDVMMELVPLQPVLAFFDIDSSEMLLNFLTLGFILVITFAMVVRTLLLWINHYLSAQMMIDLRTEIYGQALYQPYRVHMNANSSHLLSLLTEKVTATILGGVIHILMLFIALFTSLMIVVTLIFIHFSVAMSTFIILGGSYLLIASLVRRPIRTNGVLIAQSHTKVLQYIQEGLGGIRNVIMDSTQRAFIQLYRGVVKQMERSRMVNSFLSQLPKLLLEFIGIVFIVMLAYYLKVIKEVDYEVLPFLGALALAFQRLLPALQQIYLSWSTIYANREMIAEVVARLKLPRRDISYASREIHLLDWKELYFENLSFYYQKSQGNRLSNINLKIKKGAKIGFIGETGSGKSTLMDIFMGLLQPIEGKIWIDDQLLDHQMIESWQSMIAHVPQHIFLIDASIAENIAFGMVLEEIDMQRVKEVAKQASLERLVERLEHGYHTPIGERGVQLSGGERQRIGIARALYKQARIIVLDEATSALDTKTEKQVIEAINSLDRGLTILMIAHRLSTLRGCDLIIELESGEITRSGSYQEMIEGRV